MLISENLTINKKPENKPFEFITISLENIHKILGRYKESVLPEYPNFKKISFSDKSFLNDFLEKYPHASDFCFENLYNWGKGEEVDSEIAMLNHNLIIKFRDNNGKKKIVSVIGNNKINNTISILLKREKIIHYVPEKVAEYLNKDYFELIEDRDNFDYTIKISQIVDNEGNPINRVKKIKEFIKKYSYLRVENLNLEEKKTQKEILYLFNKWEKTKTEHETESLKCEYDSLKRFLKHNNQITNIAIGVYDANNLVGFNIGIKSTHKTMLGTFSKALPNYRNLFIYMVYIFAIKAKELNCNIINMDVDLGKEGLRTAKMNWGTELHKKYSVIARNS